MTAADTRFQNPYGTFELKRYPARRREPLQAWSAADSLLLEQSHKLAVPGSSILVVNDEQGALCVALQPAALWTDSALSARALQHNQQRNNQHPTSLLWSTQALSFAPQLVVLRIPKQLPYLEYQLSRLAAGIATGTSVLAAGMDKHLSPRTAHILERYIGPTERQRGQRKARLFRAIRGKRVAPDDAPEAAYYSEALQEQLGALPNVFSRDKLDPGSRFLLQQLGELKPVETLIDLACGNGVLGLAALQCGLTRNVVFADESAMAVASASSNAHRIFPQDKEHCSFHHGDGLLDYEGSPVDLILCNPPFHLNHTVDDYAGRHLLEQCARSLHPGGQLCLVANRHLDYLPTLKRDFRNVKRIAQNSKFIVWLTTRS